MIAAGNLSDGDMLPSTRELAAALEVNMMTVSKAYSKLEADASTNYMAAAIMAARKTY